MKKIEEMTLAEIKEHQAVNAQIEKAIGCDGVKSSEPDMGKNSPYVIGNKYLIRTVTFFYVGELRTEYSGELVLNQCSWVADTGRYSDALSKGEFAEVEKIPKYVIIPKSGIIDVVPWDHALPEKTK